MIIQFLVDNITQKEIQKYNDHFREEPNWYNCMLPEGTVSFVVACDAAVGYHAQSYI